MAFVALGFEHCVANMFFIPLGILTGSDPRYAALAEAGKAAALTADWTSFFVNNLLPVTLGNIAGGAVLVGMLYLLANPAAKK
jgi:formate/nitrite transporter FocA (FNT family)